jgi:hypothetical protein
MPCEGAITFRDLVGKLTVLRCRTVINCETPALCAVQQSLTGSSAILVHRTALCLLSLGRGYSRLHGVAAVCCDAETRDELSSDFIRRRSGPIGCSAHGGERLLARIASGHSPNKLKTLKRSLFGNRAVCGGLPRLVHSDRRFVGALRLRKSPLSARLTT